MSLYWKCQIGGWSAMVLWSMAISTFLGRPSWAGFGLSVGASGLGLLSTHFFRTVIHRGGWKDLPPARLAPRVLGACAALGAGMGVLTFPFLERMMREEVPRGELLVSNIVSNGFLLLGWFLIYFAYHYFQRSREAQAAEWRLRVAMRENELRTLRAQLNPHFLFNSLNSLRGLILESPERAQEAVTSLAVLLRHTLRLSSFPTVPLEQELEAARHYLELEHIRFDARLEYEISVPSDLLDQAVPPMLLQNLLENAIKHGISRLRRGGRIRVMARETEEGRIRILVENPGRIDPSPDGPGLGLANVREQLRILFPGQASLELRQVAPERVECEVWLPRRISPSRSFLEPALSVSGAGLSG